MVIDWIYMVPHGDEIIDLPSEGGTIMNSKIKKLAAVDESDTIVVLSPHGLTLPRNFSIINTEWFYADTHLKKITISGEWKNDRELTEQISSLADSFTEEARFITYSGEMSRFPMDFGTAIPLHFFKRKPVVMMGQSRMPDRQKLINFGKELVKICEKQEKKIGIIISADQAHTHSETGPYGFSPDAVKYEKVVKDCLVKGSLEELTKIDESIVKNGKPDSFWNLCVLHGMLLEKNWKIVFDYGYVEVYFGMMLAHSSKSLES